MRTERQPKVSPYIYPREYEHRGHRLHFENEFEAICQGGPTVGALLIDGERVGNADVFGGPLLFHDEWVLAPRLVHQFFRGHGFELATIGLTSKSVRVIGAFRPMVLLRAVENGEVLYYTDLGNTVLERVALPI